MPKAITGPGAAALAALSPNQLAFINSLPKAELHAHLNGSIPLSCLQQLAREQPISSAKIQSDLVRNGLEILQDGVILDTINDFFHLFPAIYALTSTPAALAFATRAVLCDFLEGEDKQCTYLELRTTPRCNEHMSRMEYVEAVLDEIESYPASQAALLVSLDRRMTNDDAAECMDVAIKLKADGRRVVGVDLCGDPLTGDVTAFEKHFRRAKAAGLGVTLHIAETESNTSADTLALLSFGPDRLGHATFFDEEAKRIVFESNICVEICLTSNLLCKTVKTLDDHHILYHLGLDHPIAICTDDVLLFRNSMLGEYALLLAAPPLGLGLRAEQVARLAAMSMERRFGW